MSQAKQPEASFASRRNSRARHKRVWRSKNEDVRLGKPDWPQQGKKSFAGFLKSWWMGKNCEQLRLNEFRMALLIISLNFPLRKLCERDKQRQSPKLKTWLMNMKSTEVWWRPQSQHRSHRLQVDWLAESCSFPFAGTRFHWRAFESQLNFTLQRVWLFTSKPGTRAANAQ